MDKKIKIKYDGEYPCLCFGHLEVWVDDIYYDFGKGCLSSGGGCGFSEDYTDSYVYDGDWTITDFPKDFPMELKEELTDIVNQEIPHGCCGGCL